MRVIYCAGEQGQVVLDILRAVGDTSDVRFADDDSEMHEDSVHGVPVIGGFDAAVNIDAQYLVAFGDSQRVRLDIATRLEDAGGDFFDAIHPSATVAENVQYGHGITVNAESYIGPGVQLGDHVLVDSCVNVSHDTAIGDGATLTPGVTMAGGVSVGKDCYVGPGATVLEDVEVGAGSIVGAGAVVTEAVPKQTTVVGVPAEPA